MLATLPAKLGTVEILRKIPSDFLGLAGLITRGLCCSSRCSEFVKNACFGSFFDRPHI